SNVPPAPISISSQWAPKQSTFNGLLLSKLTCNIVNILVFHSRKLFAVSVIFVPNFPRRISVRINVIDGFFVFEGIHTSPKSFVLPRNQCFFFDQPSKRFVNYLIAVFHVVKDFLS